jgi:hypothetical protein
MAAQANAYTALYEAVGPQSWFAGGFVWKWFMLERRRPGGNGRERDMYSPQGKSAETVLQRTWGKAVGK